MRPSDEFRRFDAANPAIWLPVRSISSRFSLRRTSMGPKMALKSLAMWGMSAEARFQLSRGHNAMAGRVANELCHFRDLAYQKAKRGQDVDNRCTRHGRGTPTERRAGKGSALAVVGAISQ